MGLNEAASAERIHIGFFGMRNAGKSSVVNAVTGQKISVVSDVKGTTTDPVKKAMELLPLGPVVIIDTPGIDDEGELGSMRVDRAREVLDRTDIAVLVIDASVGQGEHDRALADELRRRKIPYITVFNKADLTKKRDTPPDGAIFTSAKSGEGIEEVKAALASLADTLPKRRPIVCDLIAAGEVAVLVTPIDESAPKGRIILPQQLVLRELLDTHATAVLTQPEELSKTLEMLKAPPRMVITDSQVFGKVAAAVSEDIPLTSFSILMARYKGDLGTLSRGFRALSSLKDGDRVLIAEGCTHHRQCNDIGTVKMPRWIEEFTGCKPKYDFTSGGEYPTDLTPYSLVVHCGGCMLNEAAMRTRTERTVAQNVPIINYGVAIACMHGILKRSLSLFPNLLDL